MTEIVLQRFWFSTLNNWEISMYNIYFLYIWTNFLRFLLSSYILSVTVIG